MRDSVSDVTVSHRHGQSYTWPAADTQHSSGFHDPIHGPNSHALVTPRLRVVAFLHDAIRTCLQRIALPSTGRLSPDDRESAVVSERTTTIPLSLPLGML